MTSVMLLTALLLALAVDRYLGEPPTRWHPVVWMGHYLTWTGRWLAPLRAPDAPAPSNAPDFKHFWLGSLIWSIGIAIVLIVTLTLQSALLQLPARLGVLPGTALAVLGLGLALKPLLAWAMLRDEVLAVEAALGQSLAAGRERLSWLVSRDVSTLTEAQVRESAIESLAENLNDSVIAPLFWFALLGLPGAALYRFANTADAMWGYRGVRHGQHWEWAGKWAAWADDVLSWLPARLTALLLAGVAGVAGGVSLTSLHTEARRTPSPNSGWPMAAMALALNVCLHKPEVYALNANGHAAQAVDTQRAVVLASKVVKTVATISFIAIIFIALMGFL